MQHLHTNSAAFVDAITREKHSPAAQQAAADSPGNARPVLIDQATVSSFQKGDQVDAVVQSLVHSCALSSAHGLLWHGDALVVPAHESLRKDIMYNMHDSSIAGHPGIRRTKTLVRREYWWPAMDTEIEAYVQTFATCQRDKARTTPATVPLQPLEIPCRPWQSVSMDHEHHCATEDKVWQHCHYRVCLSPDQDDACSCHSHRMLSCRCCISVPEDCV